MGCWEKSDVDHVETSAGTVEILDDGKIKINGLTDADFPMDITIFFTSAFPSGAGSVNTWLYTGPADGDGNTIWVDGPVCIPMTESPTPPSETPSEPASETPTDPPTETPTDPPTETPTDPPTDTPSPTVDCAKTSSAELTSPAVPVASDTYEYEVDGCGIKYVKFMGCWDKDDIDHVDTSAGTVVILDDGKIRINDVNDSDFPLNVTIVFKHVFASGTGTVNTWLYQGPRDSDGDSIWIDGPVCEVVTETPTPPVETPTPPVETPTPPVETPTPPVETPTPPVETPTPPVETPTAPPPPVTDLTLVKTDKPDPIAPKGALSYSITVNNVSDVAAENVIMTDVLPLGVTLISATPSQGTCTGATCNLGTIPARQAVAISVVVTLNADAPTLLTNVACVATSTAETNLPNNCDEEETKVPTPTPSALAATSTPQAPSEFPNSGGIPGSTTATSQAAIAAAAAMLLFGLAAGFVARRQTVEVRDE
jgi:uncharacterized repeat protein (TIGR01451 family)